MYNSMGFGYESAGSILVLLLIKVLFAVFVISLIALLFVWIKNNFFTVEDFESIKKIIKSGNKAVKEKCEICGCELNQEWKVCPQCGKEKNISV